MYSFAFFLVNMANINVPQNVEAMFDFFYLPTYSVITDQKLVAGSMLQHALVACHTHIKAYLIKNRISMRKYGWKNA